jgi:uncharacterized membrane protein
MEEPGVARRGSRRLLLLAAAAWLVTRALVVWLFLDSQSWVTGDADYFASSLSAVPEVGLARTLVEYPLPGVAVLAFPWLLVSVLGTSDGYAEAVLVLSMLADAAFMVLLRCLGGQGRRAALTVWIAAVPLLGATAYARFDLVPGILAGTALLLLVQRPRLAAAAAALAAGLKLWPALVLPALAVPPVSRRRVVGMTAVVGLALTAVSLVLGGWGRLVSPFSWQTERGLQIESVAATPAMLARALSPAPYDIVYKHNAYEIAGPGTRDLLAASEVLSLLALGGLASLWVLVFRRGRRVTGETVVWLALAGVVAFMVTSKVLSPQYILWLLPLAAAALATTASRELRVWTAVLLLATAATQLVFPVLYQHLLVPDEQTGWAVLALLVRNVLLVWLLVRASRLAVRGMRGATHGSYGSVEHALAPVRGSTQA